MVQVSSASMVGAPHRQPTSASAPMKSRVSPTGSYLFRVQKKRDICGCPPAARSLTALPWTSLADRIPERTDPRIYLYILQPQSLHTTHTAVPAYAIMCCCPSGSSIPGAPNRASGEALGVRGAAVAGRPANAGRSVQLLTQPTGGQEFGILSSDAYSLQAAPPGSCSSRL